MIDKPLVNGRIYTKNYSGWDITWESDGNYRHWCRQHPEGNRFENDILIIMFNPGSLNGEGTNISEDTTLTILRKVFQNIPYNCFVTNLFDYANAKPYELIFNFWEFRDKKNSRSIYDFLDYSKIKTYLFANGDLVILVYKKRLMKGF